MSHSVTPWRYFKQGDGTRFHITSRPAGTPGNRFDDFATVDIGHEADAAHAVRCVNAHDDLVAACRECLELLDWSEVRHFISSKLGEQAKLHSTINKTRSAIQKAERGHLTNGKD